MKLMAESVLEIAQGLDDAPRLGTDTDKPEGSRYLIVSDTLARQLSEGLRQIAWVLKEYRL